jgi:hypothetical protein
MRLLAVAMAAALAVTSVPGTALTGIETVYAGTNTAEPAITDSLTDGHLYQEVTRKEHTHSSSCYTDAKEATTSTNYFTTVDSEEAYNQLSGVVGTDKVSIASGDTTYYKKVTSGFWTLTAENSCPAYTVPEEKYIAQDSTGNTYSLYDGVTADTTHDIEVARANAASSVGSIVLYLTSTNQTSYKGAYVDGTAESGTNTCINSSSTLSADYYTVKKYAKADLEKNPKADELPGAIKITSQMVSETGTYTTTLGFDGMQENDVYIPLEVATYTVSDATAGDTQKVGSVTYTAVSKPTSGIAWINKAVKSDTQPDKCYTINSDGSKFILQTATAATHKTDVAEYDYTYEKASVVNGEVKLTTTTIASSDTTVHSKDGKYYKDVCAEFVTGIVVKNAASD